MSIKPGMCGVVGCENPAKYWCIGSCSTQFCQEHFDLAGGCPTGRFTTEWLSGTDGKSYCTCEPWEGGCRVGDVQAGYKTGLEGIALCSGGGAIE